MIARIIPALRTPRHVDAFDYVVPEGMAIKRGDLVRIPFRASEIVGIVRELSQTAQTEKALKSITGTYADLSFSEHTLHMLTSLARRSFTSEASVLRSWLGVLPKRQKQLIDSIPKREHQHGGQSETNLMLNRINANNGLLETAKIASASKSVLIISPWASRAERIARELSCPVMTHHAAAGARFNAWSGFVRGEKHVLVTTRIGAWLSGEADLILLDEPENDDHKQDELSPRFDARWMTEQALKSGVSVISFGLTPRLANDAGTDRIPTIDVDTVNIDINKKDWSGISALQGRTVAEIEKHSGPITIIHPIHGERARLRCAECSWTALCSKCGYGLNAEKSILICGRCGNKEDIRIACPVCGSMDLSRSRPGRDLLIKDLREHRVEASVLSIADWNGKEEIPENSLVILTDLSLLAGGIEDLRRKERLIIAYRRLADIYGAKHACLVVQGDAALLSESVSWLSGDGCKEAEKIELAERLTFHLPPSHRLVKIIFRSDEGASVNLLQKIRERAPEGAEIRGPFPVLNRGTSRAPRWIGHVIVDKQMSFDKIESMLEPLDSTDALIDLDPIAFFE